MTFKNLFFTIALLLFCSEPVFSQSRFSIELGGGFAFPVGSFAKKNAEESAVYDPVLDNWNIGFSKKNNGFAKNGYFLEIDANYQMTKSLIFSMIVGQTSNPINGTTIEDMRSMNGQFKQTVSHVNNDNIYFLPGIALKKEIGSSSIQFGFNIGYSSINYPAYSISLDFLNSPTFFKTEESEDRISSTMYRIELSYHKKLTQRLSANVILNYNSSSYDYEQTTRVFPGGNINPTFKDTLNVQTLNLGVSLGYRF